MKYDFDLAVVGAGTAGLVASVVADNLGARVALIERARVGGECLWTGCVPSKTLIRAAKMRELVGRSAEFGVHVEKPRVIWNAVKLRIQGVRDEIRRNERRELDASDVQLIEGSARFEDAHTLRISGPQPHTLSARKFILATGSVPRVPDVPGLRDVGLNWRDIYSLPSLPRSLAIIGGGPIGCEFAQAMGRLGVRVTLLQRDAQLLPRDEPEAAQLLHRLLQNEGVTVHLGAEVLGAGRDESGGAWLDWRDTEGQSQRLQTSQVMVAVGKTYRWDELNLPAAGVAAGEDGVQVNEQLRTTARHIWACGDATGGPLFTHMAEHEAKIAAQNALLPVKARRETRAVPWVTFTDPEVARVGQSEAQAREKGEAPRVFNSDFSTLDRAIIEGETAGFLKVVTSGSGRVLGATIIGPSAGELLAPWVFAVRDGMLLSEFADAILPYPTLSEIGHRAGNESYRELLKSQWVQRALKIVVR